MKRVDVLPPIWSPVLGLDIETTMREVKIKGKKRKVSNPYEDKIISVAVSDGESTWMLTANFDSLQPILCDPSNTIVIHNAQFDLGFLVHELGFYPAAQIWDTLLIERLLHAGDYNYRHGLDDVLSRRCGVTLNKETREKFADFDGNFTPEILNYIEQDVLHLPKVYEMQLADLGGRLVNPITEDFEAGLAVIAWIELSLLPVIVEMSLKGVGFDLEKYRTVETMIGERIQSLEDKIANIYLAPFWHDVEKKRVEEYTETNKKGKEIRKRRRYTETVHERKYVEQLPSGLYKLTANLNSSNQVGEMLVDLGIYKKTAGKMTTAEPYLVEHHGQEPFVVDFLEYKMWRTLLNFGYPEHVNSVTGRIHPSWNQLAREDHNHETKEGTKTGRLSCSDPNLQNVPAPDKQFGFDLRSCFVPRPGYKFVVADYSQQEPRVLAQVSRDPAMIAAAGNYDIYGAFGVPVYGRVIVKGEPERDTLKVAVLADVYGIGNKHLALQLNSTEDVARKVKNDLRKAFPGAYRWGDNQLRDLVNRGYIMTRWGRRRYVPEVKTTPADKMWKLGNMARNTPVQGTAADIGKLADILLYSWVKEQGYDASILMLIHDEVVVEVREDQAEAVCELVQKAMLTAMEMVCPDVKAGVEAKVTDKWQKV
jgi:DNA polymerase I-like protein with 3'-5' exonuclease and polymerase domains